MSPDTFYSQFYDVKGFPINGQLKQTDLHCSSSVRQKRLATSTSTMSSIIAPSNNFPINLYSILHGMHALTRTHSSAVRINEISAGRQRRMLQENMETAVETNNKSRTKQDNIP